MAKKKKPKDAATKKRFEKCVADVKKKGGVKNPEAVCASTVVWKKPKKKKKK